jgi:glycosyltransferase involved in cell wall biosynthesis
MDIRQRILWIGDAGASTGFERSTRYICEALLPTYDVDVLGINYHGDPHHYPFKVWPCMPGGDFMGVGRVKQLVEHLGPSVIILQHDPWHVQAYLERAGNVPVIGYIAIDGKNARGTELNGLAHATFWTQFALDEARQGGYVGPASVIPLGVDLDIYQPTDRMEARERTGIARALTRRGLPPDAFIVGCVGRNQWRKRFDLTMEYFAEWVHSAGITDALLWMHSAPSGNDAWDLVDMAKLFRVAERVAVPKIPQTVEGTPEPIMARTYACFDALFTTTLGEGFGLPMFEAMACGVPVIAPDWSALGELLKDVAALVPCTSIAVHPSQTNTVGGVMDKRRAVEALDLVYQDRLLRKSMRDLGIARAGEPRFRWATAGRAWTHLVREVLAGRAVEFSIAGAE